MTIHRDDAPPLTVDLDTQGFDLTAGQAQRFDQALETLRPLVRDFPVTQLHVQVQHHARSGEYEVNASLVLPDRPLAAGHRSENVGTALERTVRHLARAVTAFKAELAADDEHAKTEAGTLHEVVPEATMDGAGLADAAQRQDYRAFRTLLAPYEEPLRLRIGRWIQRDEAMEAALQGRLDLEDVVEEVFLNAFEGYDERPPNVPLGLWLEHLIEPSLTAIRYHPDREKRNIEAVRAYREMSSASTETGD